MARFQKHVVIFHGYAETPKKVWIPWLVRKLQARGAHVDAVEMPDPLLPDFGRWLATARTALAHASPSTSVIGHSLGGVIALRALEKLDRARIGGLLTVGSPYCSTLKVDFLTRFFPASIDWGSLRKRIGHVTVLHAEDDPLVPYDHAYRYAESLGARLALMKKGGHFTAKSAGAVLKEAEAMLRRR